MRKLFTVAAVSVLAACATPHSELPTQANVDLERYAGTWYEQARLPNRFQKDCAGDVQADYTVRAMGTLRVVNQCRMQDGTTKVAEAEGRLSRDVDPRNPAQLQVRFAPAWLSWLSAVWGDYWIMRIEGDYQYSLVGTPDREYLWVLSRDRQADSATVRQLLNYAQAQGFDTSDIIMASD